MIEIALLLGILFALFCGICAVAHSLRVKRMTLLDWSLLAVGGMYGLGWVLVLLATQAGNNPLWEVWITPFPSLYPMHTAAAFLLVVGVLGGWYVLSSALPLRRAQELSTRSPVARSWAFAFWMMLTVAVLLQGIYTRAYGGYLGLLEYSALIRSGLFDAVPANSWSFLRPFGGLAMIAAYGFFGLRLSGCRGISASLGLVIALVFSLYILYSWLGRMGFLVFVATFILGVILVRGSSPARVILWGSVVFVLLLVSAYGVSLWLNLKAASSLLEFLARELSFPFGSFFAQWNHGEQLSRGFIDFLLSPIYLLPSSWWTSWFDPVGQVNTALIMGAPKGEDGVTGAIPVDLLTLGLMQAHLFGVFVVGSMFGLLLRGLQVLIDRVPLCGVRGILEAHVALKVAVLGAFYAEPHLVVSGNFPLIAGTLIIVAMLGLRKARLQSLFPNQKSTMGNHS